MKPYLKFCGSFYLLLLAFQMVFSQSVNEPVLLEVGKQVERTLSGAEKHFYSFSLAANQTAQITVEQRGIDAVIFLKGGDVSIVESLRFDNENASNATETVEAVTRQSANFVIEIRGATPRLKGNYAVTLREIKSAGERDFAMDEARRLLLKAVIFGQSGKIEEGIEVAQKSLLIREKETGSQSFETATALFTLGRLFKEKSDYRKSINYYEQSLKISENIYGKGSLKLTSVLKNLSNNYEEQGDLLKAEELALRLLSIVEKNLPPNDPEIADVLNNLAIIKEGKGERDAVENLYLRALKIREAAFGEESSAVAASLMNLGGFYNDIKQSEPLLLRSLAISEKLNGVNHPAVAQTLYSIGSNYLEIGDYYKAEPIARRSLEILEKTLGPEHPNTAYPLRLVGLIAVNRSKYDEAEVLYKRAVANTEKINGEYNPNLASALFLLGDLYALKGDLEKSVEYKKRAAEIKYQIFQLNMVSGTEREKLNYFTELTIERNRSLTFAFRYSGQTKAAAEMSALFLLRHKGRVLDSLAENLNAVRQSLAEKDRFLLESYNEKNKQLAKFLLSGQGAMKLEDYRAKVNLLIEEREAIEKQINLKGAEALDFSRNFSLSQIQNAIPENAVLVELSVYEPKSFNEIGRPTGKLRYGAFVLEKNGTIKTQDLGEKETIDTVVNKFRAALQDPKSQNIQQLARETNEKIIAPLHEMLGTAAQLIISPDGELNLIPFEALIDTDGKYLIEKYAISYLSSGRDLLRLQTVRTNENPPLILANPAFGLTADAQPTERGKAKRDKMRSVNVAESIADTYFAPLGGTETEAKEIKTLFPNAALFIGENATETALKKVKSPNILHLATHGFFIESKKNSTLEENPLLRSGLAFSGANNRLNKDDDGILTALESAGLNLYGTKLVVMSACGTGLGEVKTGEGVFGLRRSFIMAGAESLVISLWSVSDVVTRELMINYYRNLKAGAGRGESLRKAQLEMLKKKGREHPFYWAAFIQSGDWRGFK